MLKSKTSFGASISEPGRGLPGGVMSQPASRMAARSIAVHSMALKARPGGVTHAYLWGRSFTGVSLRLLLATSFRELQLQRARERAYSRVCARAFGVPPRGPRRHQRLPARR